MTSMKRISIVLILLFALPCHADNGASFHGSGHGVAVGGGGCPSGTYMFATTFDYPADTDKGCFTNGTVQKDGTQSGGDLSSSGFTSDAASETLTWVVASNDGINDQLGTVWVRIENTGTPDGDQHIFSSLQGNDYLDIRIRSDLRIRCYYVGNNGTAANNHSSDTGDTIASDGSDEWVGYTWCLDGGVNDGNHCVRTGNGSWVCADELTAQFQTDPDDVTIGTAFVTPASPSSVLIKEVYVYATYQADHP